MAGTSTAATLAADPVLVPDTYPSPYFAPKDQLPEPLPTEAAIRRPQLVLKNGHGRKVVRVGQHFVVKYGFRVNLTEGQNMLFVRDACATFPIPKVYALYFLIDPIGQEISYIVMEYIPGQPLNGAWESLDEAKKADIIKRLRVAFASLRSIPSPGYFGCVGRQPLEGSLFWVCPGDGKDVDSGSIRGPFDSEDEISDAFVAKYLSNTGRSAKAAFFRRSLPRVFRGHRSVFTYNGLQRKNILLQDDGSVVLTDWRTAGWYPEYWEYCSALLTCGDWGDDWSECVAQILDEYPTEFAWFNMIIMELWA